MLEGSGVKWKILCVLYNDTSTKGLCQRYCVHAPSWVNNLLGFALAGTVCMPCIDVVVCLRLLGRIVCACSVLI